MNTNGGSQPLSTSIADASAPATSLPSPRLSTNETQLLCAQGLLQEDLDKLNGLLRDKYYEDLQTRDPVAALIVRNMELISYAMGSRGLQTCEEIHHGLWVHCAFARPTLQEVERACHETLCLPSITSDGKVYFDLDMCLESAEAKQARQAALNGVRDIVLKVLIGRLSALDELLANHAAPTF